MSGQSILKRVRSWRLLPPADREFYKQFGEIAQTLIEASGKLIELFDASEAERGEISTRIETCFTRCNRIGQELEQLLREAQQPPFDRTEISQFVYHVLRVMKYIKHAANRYVVYEFPSSDTEMRELAPLLFEACQEIDKAVTSLPKNRQVEPFCRAVDELETKADDIYHHGLRRRFHEIRTDRMHLEARIHAAAKFNSPAELVPILSEHVQYTRHVAIFFILREVYAELERAIDVCTEVTATLKHMVAENV